MEQIMVSVVCTTYNHENYIRDALEGFVSQKTNFPFEVLVMDDASTDGTADIIREYEKKYPELIKPVYQTVNQYSQGLKPGKQNRERAIGKYIALCEGDDYWIDEYKLQKQVDYMESHSDCTFCFTNGKILTKDRMIESFVPCPFWSSYRRKGQIDFDVPGMELLGFIPTASFFFKNGLEVPEISPEAFSGDAYVKLVMTNYGYAHFIDEPMVVYRKMDGNSMTGQWGNNNVLYAKTHDKFIKFYKEMKKITNHKYDDLFNYRIVQRARYKFELLHECYYWKDGKRTKEGVSKLTYIWMPMRILFKLVEQYYKLKYQV